MIDQRNAMVYQSRRPVRELGVNGSSASRRISAAALRATAITLLLLVAISMASCSFTLGVDFTDQKTGNVAKVGFSGTLPEKKGLTK